jgi:hypothetical protein
LIGRLLQGGREEGGTDADSKAQRTSRQPATEVTRHVVDVIARVRPLTRKV